MARRGWIRGAVASLALGSALLAARPAEASGFYTAAMGADHGNPYMANPYAVYYNPAALSGLEGPELQLDALIAIRKASYNRTNDALSPSLGPDGNLSKQGQLNVQNPNYVAANTGKANLTNVAGAPFIGFALPVGHSGLSLGIASYVPFGGAFSWDKNDAYKGNAQYPGASDGPQRWASISGGGISLYNTLAAAYYFKRIRLSIGASFSLVYNTLNTVIAKDVNSSDEVVATNGSSYENRAYVNVHNITPAMGLGIMWEPFADHRSRVGFSWNSKPGFGQMRQSGTLRTTYGAGVQDEDVLQTQPDVFRIGGSYRVTKEVEMRLEANYIRWSVFQRQCLVPKGAACPLYPDGSSANPDTTKAPQLSIPREWKDAGGARLGVGWFVNDATELMGSLGFDTSAVPVKTIDPTFIDSFKVAGRVGVRERFHKRFALAGTFETQYYLPVHTDGQNALNTYAAPSKTPNENGDYRSVLFVFNVNGTVYF